MEMFNQDFLSHDEWKDTFELRDKYNQTFKLLVDYCADKNLLWQIIEETEHYLYITFSGNNYFWDKQFCEMVEMPDYDGLSVSEIRGIGSERTFSFLPQK